MEHNCRYILIRKIGKIGRSLSVVLILAILSAGSFLSCLKKLEAPSLGSLLLPLFIRGVGSPTFRPPLKTYQTSCWDNAGNGIPCAGTGQDGEFQRGRSANFSGPALVAVSDYITVENESGQVWSTCALGLAGPDCSSGTAVTSTAAKAATDCMGLNSMNSGAGYAHRSNWALPTAGELGSLIHYGVASPATFTSAFPGTGPAFYWTSDSYAPTASFAWRVRFNDGAVNGANDTGLNNVRCVSNSLPSAMVFSDNGDGTVLDAVTGLIWQKCSMGENNDGACSGSAASVSWSSALAYCNTLPLAGRTWRLPNVNELKSIIDISTSLPATSASSFPGMVPAAYYWSSSTYRANVVNAWTIRFDDGSVSSSPKSNSNLVFCVAM